MRELFNRRVLLNKRPVGEPKPDDFKIDTVRVREPEEGEVLLKTLWLSLDPYMRGRMNDAKSYAPPIQLGEVIIGETVNEIIRSRAAGYIPGDLVAGHFGWQEYVTVPADTGLFRRIKTELGPPSTALHVLGMTGQTAYFGLLRVGKPRPAETVVVAAASGAVGSVVGQIAKIKGCRAVGIAGGKAKCDYILKELGFDAAVDYKAGYLEADLRKACPEGIDVYFESVGGMILHAVIPLLNEGARVPICGYISQYNVTDRNKFESPETVLGAMPKPPFHRFFLVGEWREEFPKATAELAEWFKEGKLKYRESIVEGIENAPRAFIGLLRGENFGKQLIKMA
jgi:NADPH-dependent curcumin reductase CurA